MGTARRRKDRLPLAEFLEALEARLSASKPAQLRAALMSHAERLPSAEREGFLAIFEAGGKAGEPAPAERAGRGAKGEALLRDIAGVLRKYERDREAHVDGEAWHDDWDEDEFRYEAPSYRAWPTARIDQLFARADAAFRAGDLVLAREAYDRLLRAVAQGLEDSLDGGELNELVEDTDLSEAKARYLRALYETTGPDERPAALLQAMRELQYVGAEPVGLPEIMGARRGDLPDRERFLEAWVDLLGRTRAEPHEFRPELHRLLFQGVEIHRGADGLANLARRDGRRLPEAYRQWILALAEEDRTAEALGAAREALRDLPAAGRIRAWIAEFMAGEAERRGDGAARLEARREAFRANPSLGRLSALCEAAEPVGQVAGVARDEAARLRAQRGRGEKRRVQELKQGILPPGRRLLAVLHLLGGEVDEAIALAEEAPAVGWSGEDHPGAVVIPYVLVAATGGAGPKPGTALSALWQEIDSGESFFPDWDPDANDEELDEELDEDEEEPLEEEEEFVLPGMESKPRPVRLTPFLRTQLQQHPCDLGRGKGLLDMAWKLAEGRVKAIVEKKYRQAYGRAATLVAAVAEARILAGDVQRGHDLLAEIRQRFSRFYAFTGELDAAARRSPLLPSPPSKSRRW
jgi:hypothetical protein